MTASPATRELVDLREHRDPELLERFYRDLYLPAFPLASERETPEIWRPLLWPESADDPRAAEVELHLLLAGHDLTAGEKADIHGAFIFELYRASRCALLTYLVVAPGARQRGLGRELLRRGLDILEASTRGRGEQLRAAFGEVNDPRRVRADQDSIDPWQRLALFQGLGAAIIDVPYVQPALDRDGARARDLLLVAFPHRAPLGTSIPAAPVRDFLGDFYRVLGVEEPASDPDLAQSLEQLTGEEVDLLALRRATPHLTVDDFGLALHFTTTGEPAKEALVSSAEFVSFERDIVDYVHRQRPAFASRAVATTELELLLPSQQRLICEGHNVILARGAAGGDDRRRRLRALRSETRFGDGVVVHHLVLGPIPGEPSSSLDELDLIALIKLYEDSEQTDAAGQLRVVANGETSDLAGWITRIFSDVGLGLVDLRAGTLQMATGDGEPWAAIYAHLDGLATDRKVEIRRLEQGGDDVAALKALAGIVTGILDYENVDAEELADSMQWVRPPADDLVTVYKGSLVCVTISDRAFALESCRRSIGISPYLLAPHAVLLHNEELLRRAAATLANVERGNLDALTTCVREVGRALVDDYLPSVFHYPLEKQIFADGERSRGLVAQQAQLHRQLGEVKAQRAGVAQQKELRLASTYQYILALLSALAIKEPIYAALASWPGWQLPGYLIGLGTLAGLMGYLAWRSSDRRE